MILLFRAINFNIIAVLMTEPTHEAVAHPPEIIGCCLSNHHRFINIDKNPQKDKYAPSS